MDADHRPSRLFWFLGFFLLLASAGGTAWVLRPHAAENADTADADLDPEDVVCSGHVDVPSGVIALHPTQPGRVVEVIAHENAELEKGGPILQLDDSLAQLRLQEAEAALRAAQTQLEQAGKLQQQHALKVEQQTAAREAAAQAVVAAELEVEKVRRMGKEFRREEDVKIAQTQVQRLKAALQAEDARLREVALHADDARLARERAEAEVAVIEARVQQAQRAVEECVLRAPCKGTVLRLQASKGDLISPSPLQPAVLFLPDEKYIVRAEVPQESAGQVEAGQSAIIEDYTGAQGAQWKGKVAEVSRWFARRRSNLLEPGQINDVRTLECIIRIDPEDVERKRPRIGQRVTVRIKPNAPPTSAAAAAR